jgi:hypothetical protein
VFLGGRCHLPGRGSRGHPGPVTRDAHPAHAGGPQEDAAAHVDGAGGVPCGLRGDGEAQAAGMPHGEGHIGRIRGLDDRRGLLVHEQLPGTACPVPPVLSGQDEVAVQVGAEGGELLPR